MAFLIKLLLNALILFGASNLMPEAITIRDFYMALLAAFVLALLNQFLKPALQLVSLPITIFTFGLFSIIINAAILAIVDAAVKGITIHGFGWTLVLSLVMAIVQSWISNLVRNTK